MTPADYQNRFGTDAKKLRAYLRKCWPGRHTLNDTWWLTDEMIADARVHFRGSRASTAAPVSGDSLLSRSAPRQRIVAIEIHDGTVASEVDERFTIDGWRTAGFSGFLPLLELDISRVPPEGGVYGVLRRDLEPPAFAAISSGGHFNGKDPTVAVAELAANWISGVDTMYIGKARNLRERLRQYRDFGRGRRIGHRGGRYIWQLADASELIVCWMTTIDDPLAVERRLLREFRNLHGRRPFANLIG